MHRKSINFREIGFILKKRRVIIYYIVFTVLAVVQLFNFLVPPVFEAETTLRIKQPKGLLSSSLLSDVTGSTINTKQIMSTYAEILKSRTVVRSLIEKVQLTHTEVSTYEDMVKHITTLPVKDTEILKVKVTANSPTEAQLMANTLVELFIDRLTYLVRSEQSTVKTFIGNRVIESQQELERTEKTLEQYKRDQKILTPSDETKSMVDRMAYMNKLSAENAVALAVSQAKLANSEQQLNKEPPGVVADSPLIQQYKGKLADLEVELVAISQNFGYKHPKYLTTQAAIDETRQNLNKEIARVINAEAPSMNLVHQSLLQAKMQNEAEVAAASAQQEAIKRVTTVSEQELQKLPAKEQGISRLMRDVTVAQEIYIMLAKRYEEARISEVMQPTDVQIIDAATATVLPVAPRKVLNLFLGGIIGLFLGICLALYLDYSNRVIRNSVEATEYLQLPVLGIIPDYDWTSQVQTNKLTDRFQNFFSKFKHG